LFNVLRKLKCILSKQALSNIYLTFIIPVLEYACEVWDACYERDIEKLEKIQIRKNTIRRLQKALFFLGLKSTSHVFAH
jgi:hypothetical protein